MKKCPIGHIIENVAKECPYDWLDLEEE